MRRIEISGGIGAGKTTLARALAAGLDGARLVEEDVRTVPFFAEFYREPQAYAFEKNVSFLLSHADRIRQAARAALRDRAAGPILCDYALFQDLAYADIACEPGDVAAVEGVYTRLAERVGAPALVIDLSCSPQTQLRRIEQRGRPEEAQVGRDYLAALCAAVDRRRTALLASLPGLPTITLDTDALDWGTNPDDVEAVLAAVKAALERQGELARAAPSPSTPLAAAASF
ncbi:MAG TPA: deoxynucleoside kinase [Beijerinckiaceae bacterium]|jgi:deoxyadenosine/deoxycytidine kinase